MNVVKFSNAPTADQSLELADKLFADVMAGKVTTVVRPAGQSFTLGYLEISCGDKSGLVLVTGVSKDRLDFMSPAETAELTSE